MKPTILSLLDMTTYKRPIREMRALEESVTAEIARHTNCPLLMWSAEPQCPTVSE